MAIEEAIHQRLLKSPTPLTDFQYNPTYIPVVSKTVVLESSPLIEQARSVLPEEFAPQHSPYDFYQAMAILTRLKEAGLFGEQDTDRVLLPGETRNVYDTITVEDPTTQRAMRIFPDLLVFNQQENSQGEPTPVSIHEPEFAQAKAAARDYLRNHTEDVVLLGFAGEASSVLGCLKAAIDLVGAERVLAVDAGLDSEATNEAKKAGCMVIDQQTFLATCIDWNRMKSLFGFSFDKNNLPAGKGTTHFVGMLYAEAMGMIPEGAFLHHKDTDVINPNEYTPELYQALARMLHKGSDLVLFTLALRTGEGRNNEPWIHQVNAVVNSRSALRSRLGLALGPIAWPLSDSRAGRWMEVRQLPFGTSMGMETARNVGAAGYSVEAGQRLTAQVVVPEQKTENAHSPRQREFRIVYHCAQYLRDLTRHAADCRKLMHRWTPRDIKVFNQRYGGRQTCNFLPRDQHRPNILNLTTQEFLWPSVEQIMAYDMLDMEAVRQLTVY